MLGIYSIPAGVCSGFSGESRRTVKAAMARLTIHIDGAYAGKLAENEFRTWLDYEKLSTKIKSNIAAQTQEPLDLVRTYFYDCLPHQSDPPTSDEALRFGNRRKFFHALRQLSNYTVHEGRLEYRGENAIGAFAAEVARNRARM